MLGKNTFRMETYSTQNIGSSSGFPTDVFYIFTIVLGISAYISVSLPLRGEFPLTFV